MLLASACGSNSTSTTAGDAPTTLVEPTTFPADSFAVVANADIGTGRSRILLGVVDVGGARLGSPDHDVTISVSPADATGQVQTAHGIWTWIIEDVFGLYRAEFELDRPGVWQAVVQPETGPPLPETGFNVVADTAAPALGEPAPLTATPTSSEHPFAEITTDPDPDPRFYELSLDDAATNGRPTVAVFSTPAFCQTATCGPLLDIVKGIAPSYPDVDFVHIEVYTNLTDPDFAPVPANLAPSVTADGWNLPSEPWVFVIDGTGIVQGRYEGVMAAEELTAILAGS
jgi:hypothetical protein